jgi:hypothetical protein
MKTLKNGKNIVFQFLCVRISIHYDTSITWDLLSVRSMQRATAIKYLSRITSPL